MPPCPYKTHTKEEEQVKMEAETGTMLSQAEGCLGAPQMRKRQGRIPQP